MKQTALPAAHVMKRSEPIAISAVFVDNLTIPALALANLCFSDLAWIVCRSCCNDNDIASVPEWGGWVSTTSFLPDTPSKLSTVGYMRPVLHPITDYDTVQHCLVTSMEVSRRLSQQFTFVTMDLAAAKLAYDIIWSNTKKFGDVIVHLGPFHTMCSYLGSLGKMVSGSGFEEILLESGIIASGSLNQVLSGKHFNRAMYVHQRMMEALETLLLQQFRNNSDYVGPIPDKLQKLAANPSSEFLEIASGDDCAQLFMTNNNEFKTTVRNGQFGCTAQFWLVYLDSVWLLLRFHRAVEQNDFDSFVSCLGQMCSIMFSSDHIHYARYLPLYFIQMKTLIETHPSRQMANDRCRKSF